MLEFLKSLYGIISPVHGGLENEQDKDFTGFHLRS